MPVKWGLPSPRISTKLYGILALLLAIIGALATATIELAHETGRLVGEFQREGHGAIALTARLHVLLEQQRRLVASAPLSTKGAGEEKLSAYLDAGKTTAQLIEKLEPAQSGQLLRKFSALAAAGTSIFDLARNQHREAALAASSHYSAVSDDFLRDVLAEGTRKTTAAEDGLESLATRAQRIAGWVGTVAAVAGLLIGPFCLLLLNRMLARTRAISSALIRLARNDTSVEIVGTADQDELGQLARSVAVFKAKSIELLTKKADFERLNAQLDAAINNMPLGLSMFDARERLIICNRRYSEMYDVPAELTWPGTANCALWEHRIKKGARHSQDCPINVSATELTSSMLIEFDSGRVLEVWRQPIKGGGWVTLHEDITERRRQEKKIRHLARHDALTGLANRTLFREHLEACLGKIEKGRGFAVLCLDLDHFKAVNDTRGHPMGDQLLKLVATRLVSCVRQGDVVARLGGDEFAIIQAGVSDSGQTEALATRIVDTVSAPYDIEHNRISIGASIGITLAPHDGMDANTLMKNADLALYRSKSAGRRGFTFFEPFMGDELQIRSGLEVDLRHALMDETLELLYQPIVCLTSEQPVAFEAFVRWEHPNRGQITSAELFAIAEQSGVVGELGCWILREACTQAVRWPAAISVAVNLPSPQFVRRHLVENVLQGLAQTGLPAHRLELEIAKATLDESQDMLPVLHQLRQLGVRIVFDALSEGYCSLSSLRAFAFDKIKIGKPFTTEINRSKEARAIVEAVIQLGANLRMSTVAQGIEDFEQLEILKMQGCGEGQGMLLGPSLAAGDVQAFLAMRAASAQANAHLKALSASVSPEAVEDAARPGSSQAA